MGLVPSFSLFVGFVAPFPLCVGLLSACCCAGLMSAGGFVPVAFFGALRFCVVCCFLQFTLAALCLLLCLELRAFADVCVVALQVGSKAMVSATLTVSLGSSVQLRVDAA